MPFFPDVQPFISQITGRPFSRFAADLEKMGVPDYPLHIGDTYLSPMKGARMEDIRLSEHPQLHKYTSPKGYKPLVQAITKKYLVAPSLIQITPGATGALHLLAMTLLAPEDEVLILAPYWPLSAGIVRAVGAKAIDVPFYDKKESILERLKPYITKKTVAIYVNVPNNPTGLLMSKEEIEELAQVAKVHNLWIFSDEVYEQLSFSSTQYPIRAAAPERCISIFSFSKAYALAGYRCGFVLFPHADIAMECNKAVVHSFYSVSTPAQIAAQYMLEHGASWMENTRNTYASTGQRCAEILGVLPPKGGTFLFFDIENRLKGRTIDDILRSCMQKKLLLAPGSSFGTGYETYIRVCFTSAPPEVVFAGMQILEEILQE